MAFSDLASFPYGRLRPPPPDWLPCLTPHGCLPGGILGAIIYSAAAKSAIGTSMPRLRRVLRWALIATGILALAGLIAMAVLHRMIAADLPDVSVLRQMELQEPLYVHTAEGGLTAVFTIVRAHV